MFVKITNGQVEKAPYTIGEFRKSKPNVSFPKDIPTATLETNGVFVIKETAPPAVDKKTHTYRWTVEFKDGAWTQVWSTSQLDKEVAETNVRVYRDRLLAESDWTQLIDSPFSNDTNGVWQAYRQALRDVPAQAGFPWNVTWPEAPNT